MSTVCYLIRGELVCESPVHVGFGERRGFIRLTRLFIPGSVIRGVVGAFMVRALCERPGGPLVDHSVCEVKDGCAYARLFGEGERNRSSRVFFRFCYPVHEGCGGVYLPAPKTLMVCERCGKRYDTFEPPLKCDECGGPLRSYRYVCDKCGDLRDKPVRTFRVVSTAVDRETYSAAVIPYPVGAGVEKAGTLHALDVIGAGSRFRLEVVVDGDCGDCVDLLVDVLRVGLPDEGVGGCSSRGLGEVRVEGLEVDEVTRDDLLGRADGIDSRDFRVRLISPLICRPRDVYEGGLVRPETLLACARSAYSWAMREGAPKLPRVDLKDRRFGLSTFSGWSLKRGCRRPVEPALEAGSVYRYVSVGDEKLRVALAALELRAVGPGKPRGCGQVRVEGVR